MWGKGEGRGRREGGWGGGGGRGEGGVEGGWGGGGGRGGGRREGVREGGEGEVNGYLMLNTNVPYLVMKEVVRGLDGLCAPSSGTTKEYLHCVCVCGCERESV